MMAAEQYHLHRQAKGFTLLEILAVIAIISIILGLALVSFDTEREELDNEGRRIAALMKLVSEEAVLNSREYRAYFTLNGYGFHRFEQGKWQELAEGIFRTRQLPAGFSLAIEIDREPLLLDDGKTPRPAILFLSSGEITPFAVTINSGGGLHKTITNQGGMIVTLPD